MASLAWESLFGGGGRSTRARSPPVSIGQIPKWADTFGALKAARAYDRILAAAAAGAAASSEEESNGSGSSSSASAPAASHIEGESKQAAAADRDTIDLSGEEDAMPARPPTRATRSAAKPALHVAPSPFAVNPTFNGLIRLIKGDITKLQVDAITNAANTGLWAGGGICGAIFSAAHGWKLEQACNRVLAQEPTGRVPVGQTRLTRSFGLPAPFVLHTVGPMDGDEFDLIDAYKATLDECVTPRLLDRKPNEALPQIRSVALCCISTGIFGFDNKAACHVALRTTREWLEADPSRAAKLDAIVFVVFLPKDEMLYQQLLPTYFPCDAKHPAPMAEPAPDPATRPAPRPLSPPLRVGRRSRTSSPLQQRGGSPGLQQPRSPLQPPASPARRAASPAAAAARASPGSSRSAAAASPVLPSEPAASGSPRTASPRLSRGSSPTPPAQSASSPLPLPSPPSAKKRKSQDETATAEEGTSPRSRPAAIRAPLSSPRSPLLPLDNAHLQRSRALFDQVKQSQAEGERKAGGSDEPAGSRGDDAKRQKL